MKVKKQNKIRRLGPTFRQTIDAEIRLQEFETALVKAATIGECWNIISARSGEFGFSGVRMCVDGTMFEHFGTPPTGTLWQLRIPLNSSQYVNFFRDCAPMDPVILNAFVGAVERGLQACTALTWHSTRPVAYAPSKTSSIRIAEPAAVS
jgi:hypothetical protein